MTHTRHPLEFRSNYNVFSFCQCHRIIMNGIQCIASHPRTPLIAIGTMDGVVSILEFNPIDQPTILTEHHVCHDSIQKINFTGHETDVIAIDQNGGIYFIKVSIWGGRMHWSMD